MPTFFARRATASSELPALHPPIEGTVDLPSGYAIPRIAARSAYFPTVNNDLIAAAPKTAAIDRYRRRIVAHYDAMDARPALPAGLHPSTCAALERVRAADAWRRSNGYDLDGILLEQVRSIVHQPIEGMLDAGVPVGRQGEPIRSGFRRSVMDQLRYPRAGTSETDRVTASALHEQLTMAAAGPGVLEGATIKRLPVSGWGAVTDQTALAQRFSLDEARLRDAPETGGWHAPARGGRSFEA